MRLRLYSILVALSVAGGLALAGGNDEALGKPPSSPLLTIELPDNGPDDGSSCFLVRQAPGLTDLSVGSSTRALLASIAREQGLLYAKLKQVYESAFVDSAKGEDGSLALVLTLIEAGDVKSVLAQAVIEITPTHAPGRPKMMVTVRDQVQAPVLEHCEPTTLAGGKNKQASGSDEKK